MREFRRCWKCKVAKCESLLVFVVFGSVESRNARVSLFLLFLEAWSREMREPPCFCCFWKRGVAKCESLVAVGSVESLNARVSSFLEAWSREMRESRRCWKRKVAKCESLLVFVVFGSVVSRNARFSSFLEAWSRKMRDSRRFFCMVPSHRCEV